MTWLVLALVQDEEMELYELVRKLEYNATKVAKKLCKKDCKRAAKVQVEEARRKYVEDYAEWEKRQEWTKELGAPRPTTTAWAIRGRRRP